MPQHLAPKLISWASILEDNTKNQALTASSMPFIFPHVALLPDAHLGKGATVGSVIPTIGAIMPAAVGVDIGCGMMAIKTQYRIDDLNTNRLTELRESIEAVIPLSAGKYNQSVTDTATLARVSELAVKATNAKFNPNAYAANWALQLGSLGSGNHFIEVTADETGAVWLFLHSGSRGVGNKIAQHHIKVAQEAMKKWWIDLPDPDLAYLVEGTDEFWRYIRELGWAQEFARLNREEMMDRVVACFEAWHGPVEKLETIQCHHNYTVQCTPEEARSLLRTGTRSSDSRLSVLRSGGPLSTVQGSPDGYPPADRSYDELVRLAVDIDQARTPSPDDALLRSQIWSLTDDLVRVSARTRSRQRFDHPCNCQSGHRADCVAAAARTLASTLREIHPSAVETVARTWGNRRDVGDARASGHPLPDSGSLPSQQSNHSLWLSRKGAIDAHEGVMGLIPGSMGTASYVVVGKGNRLALNSSPHGAGRNYSRSAARRQFTIDDLRKSMTGIEWRDSSEFIDEIPAAYKDIDVVMADAADLVEVRHTLHQLVNVKGD